MLEFEYARSALKNGLKLEKELGVNPYKFGNVSPIPSFFDIEFSCYMDSNQGRHKKRSEMRLTYAINITVDGNGEILWNARTMARPRLSSYRYNLH